MRNKILTVEDLKVELSRLSKTGRGLELLHDLYLESKEYLPIIRETFTLAWEISYGSQDLDESRVRALLKIVKGRGGSVGPRALLMKEDTRSFFRLINIGDPVKVYRGLRTDTDPQEGFLNSQWQNSFSWTRRLDIAKKLAYGSSSGELSKYGVIVEAKVYPHCVILCKHTPNHEIITLGREEDLMSWKLKEFKLRKV